MNKILVERFEKAGMEALNDVEILEILLGLNGTRKNESKAKELSAEYGSFRDAVDSKNVFAFKFIKAVMQKYAEETLQRKKFVCRSSKEVFDYLYMTMRGLSKEVFTVLYLDVKNNLLKAETAFEGSLTSTSIYPRQIVKRALELKAAALIFAHNHPSGETEPSDADREITKSLVLAGSIMEMRVLDHIIIGDNKYFSFADNGLIREYELNARLNKKV